MRSPPCPVAVLRAAATYAAIEAGKHGGLAPQNAWRLLSALSISAQAAWSSTPDTTTPAPAPAPSQPASSYSSAPPPTWHPWPHHRAPPSHQCGMPPWSHCREPLQQCAEPARSTPLSLLSRHSPAAAAAAATSPVTSGTGPDALDIQGPPIASCPSSLLGQVEWAGPLLATVRRSAPSVQGGAAALPAPAHGHARSLESVEAPAGWPPTSLPPPWRRAARVRRRGDCGSGAGEGPGPARKEAPMAAGDDRRRRPQPGQLLHVPAAAVLVRQYGTSSPSLPMQLQQQSDQAQQQQPQGSGPGISAPRLGFVGGGYDVASFPPERIRNFSIIAHVDHGKSTLADRLMEMTGALGARATHNAQYLDKLQVERERGITVKAQTVSLVYDHKGLPYLLNLIDTPGHVDFSYEVSRSLAACQGALLVVDAGQGIQAQTVANFYLAFEQGMDLVPVVNKIDLPAADPRGCAEQMAAAFDMDPDSVLFTSAKTGRGMEAVLPAVVERIRAPRGNPYGPLRMLLFDAFHDDYRGVVLLVEVVDGAVTVGQRVAMASTGAAYEVQEVGLQAPERHPTGRLLTGQVGYLLCGIKDLKAARVGDTLFAAPQGPAAEPPPPRLPGFKPAKAMVFAGLFPLGGDGQEFEALATAMDKLLLNDASVVVKRENSEALGPGFRCGFLGMLHMEIFTQRLQHEFGASVVTTTPMVPYMLEMPDGTCRTLESASDYPTTTRVSRILEPTVTATIISSDTHLGRLMELCTARRGEQLEHGSLGGGRSLLRYRLPLAELAGDFYSAVKSRSQGYASFDYEEGPYRPADLVRLDILAHGRPVDALARMVAREEAATIGRALLVKMRDLLDRQQFEVVLQAAVNGKVVARETLKALRKNVTAKCYGGDVTRKRKLLDRQKEGKRRMKRLGSIDVPQELFPELMKTR